MSFSLNRATLIGHLGQDPEIRRTQDGRPIVNLSLATSENWRDKTSGERRERTEWHRIVVFNENLAKICEQYMKKGSLIFVEGKIATRSWEDQAGTKKYTTEIVVQGFADRVGLMDRLPSNRPPPAQDAGAYGRETTRPASPAGAPAGGADFDDEIPF